MHEGKGGPHRAAHTATGGSNSPCDSTQASYPRQAEPPIPLNHPLRRHPDFDKLLLDPDHFWRPMMASVSRPITVAGECAVLREAAEQADDEAHQLRSEMSQFRRTLAELQARFTDDSHRPPPRNGEGLRQTSRPRIEVPPTVGRSRKGAR